MTLTLRRLTPGAPPAAGALGAGEVQVWQLDLDDPGWPLGDLRALLSRDELQRCGQLRTALLARRFVVRRAALRLLLGGYLGRAPELLRFSARPGGKPELLPGPEAGGLSFNVSDCDARALYACTRVGPVGVDLEALAPLPDLELVARRWFSAAEQSALAGLPPAQRLRGFYQAWTRKEALVKAEGSGIALPLDRFSVSLAPGEPARLLRSDLPLLHAFELLDVPVEEPYVAACAVWRAAQ